MTEQLKICGKLLRQERADSECRYIYINPNGPEAVETIEALVKALEPFARGPDGTSLAKLYAHLNREHYRNAVAALSLASNGEQA